MKKKITAVVLALICCKLAFSQLAMGKWRTHLAYNSVSQITQSDSKIFAVSEGALFSVDKTADDGGMEFYSKLSGLNGSNIVRISYDSGTQQMLIVYENGNIDAYTNGGVVNIPDLYLKQMSASKVVNNIQFYQNRAYLSCDFGIVVLDMLKREVADTYMIGEYGTNVKVLNTAIYNGSIYAVTASKVYKASITDPMLVDYGHWVVQQSLPGSGDFKTMISYAGNLFLLRNTRMYKMDATNIWSDFRVDLYPTDMKIVGDKMIALSGSLVYSFDNLLNSLTIATSNSLSDVEYDTTKDTYWFAAGSAGILECKSASSTPVITSFKPAGPTVNNPSDITFAGDKMFVVQGGRWSVQYFRPGHLMIYQKGVWTNILASDLRAITGSDVYDFMNVAVDPANSNHFFVTSFGTGLYEFRNNSFYKWHNTVNSGVETHVAAPGDPNHYTRLDGAVYDNAGNLFIANSGVPASIKAYTSDSTWVKLTYPNAQKETLGKVLVNSLNPNHKWMISVRGGELIVFDDKGTIKDQTDDRSIVFNSFTDPDNQGKPINPESILCIAQDHNGTIWVGTEAGPLMFQNPLNVFNAGYTCSRVKIARKDSTNLADYLLINDWINAIAVDGANRKWFATKSSGVYLMSENGQETIQHFTVNNSPLLSNNVLSIGINQQTGEVFFGTAQGLVSYQSDASEADESFGEVYAYPNPVRENYNGLITITGLSANTNVKITDINGNLVCQTVSNGSIATWNGRDVHGKKVSTGVYLAVCVNEGGTQSTITKILVIN